MNIAYVRVSTVEQNGFKSNSYEKCGFYEVVYEGNILKTVRENIGLAI